MNETYLQDLGEIKGKLELFMSQSEEQRKAMMDAIDAVGKEVTNLKNELTTYKTIGKVVKWIGLMILALLTFKFGDAINLWHSILGAVHGDLR